MFSFVTVEPSPRGQRLAAAPPEQLDTAQRARRESSVAGAVSPVRLLYYSLSKDGGHHRHYRCCFYNETTSFVELHP